MNDNKILVLDIETTGFLKQGGSIVEIGIVELDLNTGEITEIFDSLCREKILTKKHREKPFGWIFENSDLTIEELREAPTFEEIKEEVQAIFDRYPMGVTAYNKAFDLGFLKSREFQFKELPCPMIIATPICAIPFSNGRGTKWPSVEEAFAYFLPDVEYTEKHRGCDDAFHEAMIVYQLYVQGHFKIS